MSLVKEVRESFSRNSQASMKGKEDPEPAPLPYASSAVHLMCMTEFKRALFDSQKVTRGNNDFVAVDTVSPTPSGGSTPTSGSSSANLTMAGMVSSRQAVASVTKEVMEDAPTVGNSGFGAGTPIQRPVVGTELDRERLALFAFGESMVSPSGPTELPSPPYKMHIVPYEENNEVKFTQIVLSTVCYWEQELRDVVGSTRLRKVAAVLVVTTWSPRDYGLFLSNMHFLRAMLHRCVQPCADLGKKFYDTLAQRQRITERDQLRVIAEMQKDSRMDTLSKNVKEYFNGFMSARMLCPVLSSSTICMPDCLKRLVKRPPPLRASQKGAAPDPGAAATLALNAGLPVTSEAAVMEAMVALNDYGAPFLAQIIAGCLSVSDLSSFGFPRCDCETPERQPQYQEPLLGRVVIATANMDLARHLIVVVSFFFRQDYNTHIEQRAKVLNKAAAPPDRNKPLPPAEKGAPPRRVVDYTNTTISPLFAAYTKNLQAPIPIVWVPQDRLPETDFDQFADRHAVENALLVITPQLLLVSRHEIFRKFSTCNGGEFTVSLGEELRMTSQSQYLIDLIRRAVALRDGSLLQPTLLLEEEIEYVFHQATVYRQLVRSGLLPPFDVMERRMGDGDGPQHYDRTGSDMSPRIHTSGGAQHAGGSTSPSGSAQAQRMLSSDPALRSSNPSDRPEDADNVSSPTFGSETPRSTVGTPRGVPSGPEQWRKWMTFVMQPRGGGRQSATVDVGHVQLLWLISRYL